MGKLNWVKVYCDECSHEKKSIKKFPCNNCFCGDGTNPNTVFFCHKLTYTKELRKELRSRLNSNILKYDSATIDSIVKMIERLNRKYGKV